jgi:hypothetical protein
MKNSNGKRLKDNFNNRYGYKCIFCSDVNLSKFNVKDEKYSLLQLENVIKNLPKIDDSGILEIMNIIEQSKKFTNPRSSQLPTNIFELSYANYVATKDENFLNTYLTVLTEACFREFMEWYEYITKHLLEKEVQDAIGIKFDPTNTNWEAEFKKSELFGWTFQLTDMNVFLENLEKVDTIGRLIKNFFNNRRSYSISDSDYFESEHAHLVLESITKILLQKDMVELKNQLESNKILCMIETYGWENRFNPILLSWICDNKDRIKKWV